MDKIAILLSSYNGNDYIEEQIASIYRQTYTDFELYIRDDGSDVQFRQQLQALQQQYGFQLILGENVGFVNSFMELLEQIDDATYYAFSDQDDVWLENKLQSAVQWFQQNDISQDIPALYHSAYDIVQPSGNVTGHFYYPNEGYDFRRSITENHYSGFSMVVNKRMRDMMLEGRPSEIGYHDWWAAMIAHAFGVGYSDHQVMALHRSHGDNVTTFNLRTRLAWLKKTLVEESELSRRVREFERCFGETISKENYRYLKLFCGREYSFFVALQKCFYPKRWRPVWSSELVMRFLMLIGKI